MICTRPGCGKHTNNPSGVCIICEKFSALNEELADSERRKPPKAGRPTNEMSVMSIEKKEKTMAGVTGSKKCIDCGNEYAPTSNVQKRCPACAEKHKVNKDRKYREGRKTTAPSPRKGTQQPEPIKPAAIKDGGVLSRLIEKQSDLQQELSAIELTIETIRKYAA